MNAHFTPPFPKRYTTAQNWHLSETTWYSSSLFPWANCCKPNFNPSSAGINPIFMAKNNGLRKGGSFLEYRSDITWLVHFLWAFQRVRDFPATWLNPWLNLPTGPSYPCSWLSKSSVNLKTIGLIMKGTEKILEAQHLGWDLGLCHITFRVSCRLLCITNTRDSQQNQRLSPCFLMGLSDAFNSPIS